MDYRGGYANNKRATPKELEGGGALGKKQTERRDHPGLRATFGTVHLEAIQKNWTKKKNTPRPKDSRRIGK